MAHVESELVEKDKTISKLKGTVNELADAVAPGEGYARRYQAEPKDQAR